MAELKSGLVVMVTGFTVVGAVETRAKGQLSRPKFETVV